MSKLQPLPMPADKLVGESPSQYAQRKGHAPSGPVPGTWSVYDKIGRLCATGYPSSRAAEMYAPVGFRNQFKFILEPMV